MKAEFDFDAHARQRIDYIGVTFRTRTIEEVREILVKMRADLWDDVKAGRIKVPIDKTYPLAERHAGHEHMRDQPAFRQDFADPVDARLPSLLAAAMPMHDDPPSWADRIGGS